jgi:predicted enzyme related to lactoylglutathione lyase
MHKSRLSGFIIDCETEDLPAAARFWSAALGMRVGAVSGASNNYIQLDDALRNLHVEVQAVDHASRVHLDIEADDIEAEVKRLEGLGAQRVRQVHGWWVMQAPTGQRFCVVRPQAPDFAERSNTWD